MHSNPKQSKKDIKYMLIILIIIIFLLKKIENGRRFYIKYMIFYTKNMDLYYKL